MRQIRVEVYVGFADAPRAYDNLKLRLTNFESDDVAETIKTWVEASITELDEMRADDDTTDN